jgi:hypothetical protein
MTHHAKELAMTTARRMTLVMLAVLGVALSGAAQTASQKCADAVRGAYPDEARVWVVSARGEDDHTELSWQSEAGRVGICRLEPDGRISHVAATGRREPAAPEPAAPPAKAFEPYRLTCESEHGERTSCEIKPSAVVTLVEQLGKDDCIAGLTWDQDGDTIWVDRGCRADFEVSPRPLRVEPSSLAGQERGPQATGQGMQHPRFQESRAQQQCRNLAASRGILVKRIMGSRIEGSSVVVLMEVETWSQRQEVTCRYDPATDQALIAH